jgi:hypothetical protein
LPHILGQKMSTIVIALTALVATLMVVTQSKNLDPYFAAVGFCANIVIVGIASSLSLKREPPRAAFLLLLLASLVNVILLILGIDR